MKTLLIVTKSKNTGQSFKEQLLPLIGAQVHIETCMENEWEKLADDTTTILASNPQVLPETGAIRDKRRTVVYARRSIHYREVDQLFDIPCGTEVLLVNDTASTACETIELLEALGINHITYAPYAPEMRSYRRLKIAVTPGERHLAPGFVEKVIDIRSRILDITTVVELLDKMGLLNERANLLSANYMREMIDLIKAGKDMIRESNDVKNQLQTIINTVHDGIISTDEARRIRVFNPVVEQFFNMARRDVIGRKIDQLENGSIQQLLADVDAEREAILRLNERRVVINVTKIYPDKPYSGRVYVFKDVSEIQRLEEKIRRRLVSEQKVARYTFEQIIGASEPLRRMLAAARKMALSESTILIQGESGVGKELVAQGIHNASARRDGPFIAVNIAALTESLLESELFGYDAGSFTGARKGGQSGLFEEAHKGTIFLDEIGDAPLPFQVKLLRVLQEQQVRRVGGSRTIPVDVRVIAATNCDLKVLIERGLFRRDLYYRLNVLPIKAPPLRERRDDIMLLAEAFYRQHGRQKPPLPPKAYFARIRSRFLAYDWPGNIRELQNVVEYLVNISPAAPPGADELPEDLRADAAGGGAGRTEERIFQIVRSANRDGRSIGRRSLAALLGVSEKEVRRAVAALAHEGRLIVRRDRKGLVARP